MAKPYRPRARKSQLTDPPGPGSTSEDQLPAEGGAPPQADASATPNDKTMTDSDLLRVVRECRREAADAKKSRMLKNSANQMAYMDQADYSHKQPGQSAEFLPKVSTSAEQFSAFVKRALTQFGDWFSIELNQNLVPFLTDTQMKELLKLYLHNIPSGINKTIKFETVVADASKAALLDSLIILKIHGKQITQTSFTVEPGQPMFNMNTGMHQRGDTKLNRAQHKTWRLCIDMVKPEDYFPDPTGRGLYEIHSVERDFHQIVEMADAGIYDPAVVMAIDEDFTRKEEELRKAANKGQDRSEKPSFRRTIVIDEFWGTILDEDGLVAYENCICAVANDKYIIRKPEPNPYWHGESIFVTCPLIRVPYSVWHKALYDSATDLNLALNEMFNLMLDGGLAAVWGIKQLRTDYLQDASQIQNGIPQGITLAVKGDLPPNAKVIEKVTEGAVPTDAMAIFEMVAREFTQAALTNDIKLGSLPPRQVKATEITQADQNQAVTLDSIAADIENDLMEPALRKSWLTIIQHIEDFDKQEIITTIGPRAARWLLSTNKAERFAMFANIATFQVNGLTSLMSRVRDFQKTMALMQVCASNPVMMQAFFKNYSPERLLKLAMKQLNFNPDDIARTPDQIKDMPQELAQIMLFSQLMGGGQPANDGSGGTGMGGDGSGLGTGGPGGMVSPMGGPNEGTAQINQEGNPMTGMRT